MTEKNASRYAGLTVREVEASRSRHGANILAPPERVPWWRQFLEKFDDPVIRILLIAAGIAILTGEWLEGSGIIVAVLLATGLGFLNEYRAGREFDILNRVNDDTPVKTVRDGKLQLVAKKELVVGDVILIETGEEIPADGMVLEAVNFQVDQSRLTGESDPVEKHSSATAPADAESTYPPSQVLRGTPAVDGYAYIEVSAVGAATEIGKTAADAAIDTGEKTPLNRQLESLGNLIGVIGFSVSGITFAALVVQGVITGRLHQSAGQWAFFIILVIALFVSLARVWLPVVLDGVALYRGRKIRLSRRLAGARGWLLALAAGAAIAAVGTGLLILFGWLQSSPSQWLNTDALGHFVKFFMIAVTLIVVAVPEGLAMSVTLSLAYSMRKMTASNNLVRRMHACETIGAATVICTDKTGTLTMNRMQVSAMETPGAPELTAAAVAVNSTANLAEDGSTLGNPTEGALLQWLANDGRDYRGLRDAFTVTRQWTFSTERKFMATQGHAADGREVLHVKGAPEIVMARSTLSGAERDEIQARLREYQARGMRTLGFAWRGDPVVTDDVDLAARDLTWLGFAVIADPVRPDVPQAIAECRNAGIQVKIVTGDTQETAREIGRQVHIFSGGEAEPGSIMTGPEFQALSDGEAVKAAEKLRIMARARPDDKLKLVRALKRSGEVVAVTGDGTNDAPALNQSDVGIAMGKTGTAIAREAADIILLDDSFTSIVKAVEWGRSLYRNIQRFIVFQLTVNVVALSIAMLGPFIGVEMPLTVIQMLWVNLIMDTFAALALATEPSDPEVMNAPPRPAGAFIVTPAMWRRIFGVGVVFLALLLTMLFFMKHHGLADDRRAQTVFFSVFVLLQFWNLFNSKCFGSTASIFTHLFRNKAFLMIAGGILAGQIVIVHLGGNLMRTVPLGWRDWLWIIAGTSLILWGGEAVRFLKKLLRR